MGRSAAAALIRAARDGDLDAARRALKDGADIDRRDADGWTAAMWAARRRRLAVFELLVREGADLALRDGLNHDAGDIAGIQHCDRYDHGPSAERIQWITLTHPHYDATAAGPPIASPA
jgi:hypothetical protein